MSVSTDKAIEKVVSFARCQCGYRFKSAIVADTKRKQHEKGTAHKKFVANRSKSMMSFFAKKTKKKSARSTPPLQPNVSMLAAYWRQIDSLSCFVIY